jgi:hypothetical protein
MDLKTILPLVVGAAIGFAATMLTLVWGSWSKRSENQRSATYLAIRLAVILEQFAIDCADRIADQDLHDNSLGHAGAVASELPKLEAFPDEQSWNALNPALLARVLSFPNTCRLSNLAISAWYAFSPEDVPEEGRRQCGKTGQMAWVLACDLRKQYRLQPFQAQGTSTAFVERLEQHHDKALRHEAGVRQTLGKATAEIEGDGSEWG